MSAAVPLITSPVAIRQALRLKRLGVAAMTYALTAVFVALACLMEMLPLEAALQIGAAYAVINVGLYAAIRSGFNLRFADPSLTRFQILVGITVVMFIVYHMDDGRELALFGCFLVFLFGIFRLSAREFAAITLYTLMAYALVIALLVDLRPAAIPNVPRALIGWALLAGFLPCFNVIAAQFNELRRRLRESESRFRSLTEMSSDFHWETDECHRFVRISARMPGGLRKTLGKTRWEIPYLAPDAAGWRAHREVLDAHVPFRGFELARLNDEGDEQHITISGDPVLDASGTFRGYSGVGTDITTRKRADKALRESAEKLRLFADNIPAMTVSWDSDLRCRFANKVFVEFFGLALDDIVGEHVRVVLGEEMFRELEAHFVEVQRGYPVTYGSIRRMANADPRYLEIRVVPHIGDDDKVNGCLSVITDITGHKQAEERIQRVAHHDSLTGLPNRLLFNDRLEQAVRFCARSGASFALLYVDLDKFKPVNDTFGHAAGDALLKSVAGRIRRHIRGSDTVARIGGDEFAIILLEIGGRDQAQAVAAKIVAVLAEPGELASVPPGISIGCSIGIAMFPADAADAQSLIEAADAAMYEAKHARAATPRAA